MQIKRSPRRTKRASTPRIQKVRTFLPPVAERFKRPSTKTTTENALKEVPRITNETVAEHRETVLKGARKYKYPLEHSKHRIVVVSTSLLGVAIIGFIIYTMLSLYRWQATSSFMYRVTQVMPLPIAKVDDRWVSYESYLFELRRYMHYYQTQQNVDFGTESGVFQLKTFKPKAMEQVVEAAYVKELAAKNNVKVTEDDVNKAINTLRAQNQLGSGDEELASVTKKFFGWSLSDLRKELRQEILAQKVAAALDKTAYAEAQNVLVQIRAGGDFANLASQVSDDVDTKSNGGQYNDAAISLSSQEVPPIIVSALAKMKPGEVSDIITTQNAFEIVKLVAVDNGKYKAAHIQIRFRDIQSYVAPLKKTDPPRYFVKVDQSR